jgi:hypothetical protein
LELIKDYNLEIHYHPGKANVVADALSRRSYGQQLVSKNTHLQEEIAQLNMHIVCRPQNGSLKVQPTLEKEIKKVQHRDKDLIKIHEQTRGNKAPYFKVDDKETL